MVQRYETYGFCVADTDGSYVKYEEYAELERKFNELRAWRSQILNDAFDFLTRAEKAEAELQELKSELQKYKDQFPDYVECANCGSVTHVEGAEDAMGQSGCQIGEHDWVLDADEDYFVCRSCGETT